MNQCPICGIMLKPNEVCDCIEFKKDVKKHCFICGKRISGGWKRYQVRGNCCHSCISKVNKELDKRAIDRTYQKSIMGI